METLTVSLIGIALFTTALDTVVSFVVRLIAPQWNARRALDD